MTIEPLMARRVPTQPAAEPANGHRHEDDGRQLDQKAQRGGYRAGDPPAAAAEEQQIQPQEQEEERHRPNQPSSVVIGRKEQRASVHGPQRW
ncbi:MAG: hypothetical protein H6643_03640 [Caldilineaceae bacterium]|nr:hypothetical protein [Caldilineaceae bacterium]